jgi:hypothetical protein
MNIEKLAKHLKKFTLDEIEMIAECDCKTELEHLLNEGKIVFEQGLYKYVETDERLKFGVFIDNSNTKVVITIEGAVQYFINNYVAKYCSKKTNRIYKAAFKLDIIPILKKNSITKFETKDIITIYNAFLEREFKPRRLKNTMALLKQFLKYCKAEGLIKNYTNFYVKRLTEKNEYSLDRIIFEV